MRVNKIEYQEPINEPSKDGRSLEDWTNFILKKPIDKKIEIGFTGSQRGLAERQNARLFSIVQKLKENEMIGRIRHGGCKGGDTSFHLMIPPQYTNKILIHPGDVNQFEFWNNLDGSFKVFEPRPYLERNKDIVNPSKLMLVCPDGYIEKVRSGTWATYRYAKKQGKKIIIIYPDGIIKMESGRQ